jgi:hypothetical protein
MTGILKFALFLQIVGYIIYFFTFILSLGNSYNQGGILLLTFLIVTVGFFIVFAMLASIIELRERFLDGSSSSSSSTYRSSNTSSQNRTGYVPPTFPNSNRSGSFNIMQSGGSLIEDNQMNTGWTCDCGIKNQSGTKECINCGKRAR